MNTNLILIIAAIIGAWITFSPDVLAEVIRVRIFQAKSKLAKQLDSAIAREEKELADEELGKARADQRLLEQKDHRNELRLIVDGMEHEIADMETASQNAARVGDTAAVEDAMKKRDALELDIVPVRDQLAEAEAVVKDSENRIAELAVVIKQQRANVLSAKSQASSAKGADLDAIIASLSENQNHEKALELLRAGKAHAMTMREEANAVIEKRREAEKLKTYAAGPVAQKAPVDERAAALIASYKK